MDPKLEALLAELEEHGRNHDAGRADRLERLRNVEPETGRMLSVLVRALAPARLLELGTSNGYSTLWLAAAAASYGGRLTSVEILPERSEQARATLERAGLGAVAELRVQDAGEALEASGEGEWQLVFLDSERPAYAGYWPALVRALSPGGLIAIDNVISHAAEVVEITALIEQDERFATALVPIGAGVLLAAKER
jgi:predicted O-methyltransferase YrrM